MLHVRSRIAAAFAAIPLLVSVPAMAEPTTPRPPGGNLGTCYVAPNSEFGCEGAICWCCHTDGCFICNQDFGDCQWDPATRIQRGHLGRLSGQPLTPTPGLTAVPSPGNRR